jgi:hypothetical protein
VVARRRADRAGGGGTRQVCFLRRKSQNLTVFPTPAPWRARPRGCADRHFSPSDRPTKNGQPQFRSGV